MSGLGVCLLVHKAHKSKKSLWPENHRRNFFLKSVLFLLSALNFKGKCKTAFDNKHFFISQPSKFRASHKIFQVYHIVEYYRHLGCLRAHLHVQHKGPNYAN
jgi:hypothetical protein